MAFGWFEHQVFVLNAHFSTSVFSKQVPGTNILVADYVQETSGKVPPPGNGFDVESTVIDSSIAPSYVSRYFLQCTLCMNYYQGGVEDNGQRTTDT